MASPTSAGECRVTFQPIGTRVVVKAGTTLLQAGRDAGLLLSAHCGGAGLCGRCCVTVISGEMEQPSEVEQAYLDSAEPGPGVRLACEARVSSPSVVVQIPQESLATGQRLQFSGTGSTLCCEPLIHAHQLRLSPPTLADPRSDYRRVADALDNVGHAHAWTMHPRAAAQLSRTARVRDWALTAYTRGSEVIGFSGPDRLSFGLAVDVGCTKIAAYLLDLQSGAQLAAGGVPNPQLAYGEDLITRLVFAARSPDQADLMAKLVRGAINDLAAKLCLQAEAASHEIADICIVGNTAMVHLLLGLPVQQLLNAPFVSSIDRDLDIDATDLSLECAPGAQAHLLPAIGGFVGADHVAMILSHGIAHSGKVTIGIDVGTNTEIVANNPLTGAFVATSVPSGPAFEGGHVSDGMRAASGAIETVVFVDGLLQFRTIDGSAPIGICGSGTVDLLAELYRLDYIDERGHLLRRDELVRAGKSGLEFLVVPAAKSGHGRDIVFTQHDITEIQLAKAAICAGIITLMEITRTSLGDVEEMVVAGAFGTFLDLGSAVAIGLLPRMPAAEYLQIGNAAGAGAKMALISSASREQARMIAANVTRVELKQHESFNRALARATRFPSKTQMSEAK